MSWLWVLPLLFVAVGAAVVGVAARQTAEAGARLREECARLQELRVALVDLQAEAGATRSALEGVRSRSVSGTTRG